MKKNTFAETLKLLMKEYNEKRTLWIKQYGSDIGFNDWFGKWSGVIK